jgi:hypothetical protein
VLHRNGGSLALPRAGRRELLITKPLGGGGNWLTGSGGQVLAFDAALAEGSVAGDGIVVDDIVAGASAPS